MELTVAIEGGHPTPAEALDLYRALFPRPGRYVVGPEAGEVVKAGGAAAAEDFEEWFLDALFDVARGTFQSSREAIWAALDRLIQLRGANVPSDLDLDELGEALFDLSTASTARMVGLHVPREMVRRLESIGFTTQEALDFPAVAYRMGLIYRDLAAATSPVPAERLIADAKSIPLTQAEEAAVDYARRRAGIWMRPIFDRSGTLWTAERELFPVRSRVGDALSARTSSREAARQLRNTYRALEIDRDAERVMRTEIAEASNRGAWAHAVKGWQPDTEVFRQPSRSACKGCLRLYLTPDGMPRLYTVREIEDATALGPNMGSWRTWHPVIGATHPQCVCGPLQEWRKPMTSVFARTAPGKAQQLRDLRVFDDEEG